LTGKGGYRFTAEKDVCVYIPKKVKLERVIVMKTSRTAGDQSATTAAAAATAAAQINTAA